MANQYVEELRYMTGHLAVSEAQQRRVFFEKQMQDTKSRLVAAQLALQDSGSAWAPQDRTQGGRGRLRPPARRTIRSRSQVPGSAQLPC
jgi:hypothetical protein